MDATPRYDIEFRQGVSRRVGFVYMADDQPVLLDGRRGILQVRDRPGGRVFAELTTENGLIDITEAEGKVDVLFPHSVTKSLSGKYEYDLFLISADNTDAICLVSGELMVNPSITRVTS